MGVVEDEGLRAATAMSLAQFEELCMRLGALDSADLEVGARVEGDFTGKTRPTECARAQTRRDLCPNLMDQQTCRPLASA